MLRKPIAKKQKKAQGLSMSLIIKAVLGLVVLVIIIAILSGKFNIFDQSTSRSCVERSGSCDVSYLAGDCPDDKPVKVITKECGGTDATENKRCCVPVGK